MDVLSKAGVNVGGLARSDQWSGKFLFTSLAIHFVPENFSELS